MQVKYYQIFKLCVFIGIYLRYFGLENLRSHCFLSATANLDN